ncbi:MAG TPA: prephenate dehydratase [Iamia sp.]|nr:prephenate dehydratase [Iamia sp.]
MAVVAYLGPEGTFAHAATDLLRTTPADAEMVPRPTVQEIVHDVEAGRVPMGLVPIENSVEGGVTGTIDVIVFETTRVVIREEVAVPVTFTAFRRPGDDTPAATALSHPVGLAQTTKWWGSRNLVARSTSSTSEACRLVAASEEPGLVAIASAKAGEVAGLDVVAEGVEDHPGAQTRFALVARKEVASTGDDRTTVVVTPPESEVPRVLLRILEPISRRDINLSNIVSRPLRKGLGVYCFVLTLDRHASDPAVAAALADLRGFGCEVKSLGSYPAWREA